VTKTTDNLELAPFDHVFLLAILLFAVELYASWTSW